MKLKPPSPSILFLPRLNFTPDHSVPSFSKSFLPFLKHIFPKEPPPWLQDSAMPSGGLVGAAGTIHVRHRAALAVPHRGPSAARAASAQDMSGFPS